MTTKPKNRIGSETRRVGRFGIVGIINTLLDFSLFNVMSALFGLPLLVANVISTSVAMTFSFIANRSFVFRSQDKHNLRQALLFLAGTAFSVYIIQNLILLLFTRLWPVPFELAHSLVDFLLRDVFSREFIVNNGAKFLAVGFGMVWNYLWYKRVVFRPRTVEYDAHEEHIPQNNRFDLSIIIPSHHEGELLGASLESLAAFLKSRNYGQVEVIVVSDGSHADGEIAETKKHLFDHLLALYPARRMGKGGAVRMGMFEARGRYRLFMDADLATPLTHLDEVFNLMQQNVDVAIAVRNLWRIHKGLIRKSVTKLANIVVRVLLLPGIKDTQCGFKLFSAKAAQQIFSRQTLTSWSFDMEILKIARILKYRIYCIEAPDWKDPKAVGLGGESVLGVAIQQAKDPLIVFFNWLAGQYRYPTYRYRPAHPKR
ncbi:GtrA family protein [Candidatus Microgenomates bacterium]|nr:GtrA family protein [Candidatus Microgenomates bacterium]